MENVDFHDFLDRMRNPAAADLVRSIKSFIMEFSNKAPDPENDSVSVQEFMTKMEGTFKGHPLWAGATDEELESAGEGLEKYLMTKLFNRAFAPLPEDAENDQKLFEKICMLQQFIRPEHLDIPPKFQNETSWLLAQKELQKINTYKAPRDKLVSILNCSRVILNVSMAENESPPGADEFLPVLIYVTIKANPPQLHSNLLYIQRYRHHSRLVSEAAYFYTNLVSAESFIMNLDASSLTLDEKEFERNMQAARGSLDGMSHPPASEMLSEQMHVQSTENLDVQGFNVRIGSGGGLSNTAKLSTTGLQTDGYSAVLEADRTGQLAREFPFLYASMGDLRVEDVESLLRDYKELALKYHALCKAVDKLTVVKPRSHQVSKHAFAGGVDASEEDLDVPMVSEKEAPRDLSHLDPVARNKVPKIEAEESAGKISPEVFDGLSVHTSSLEMEDKNVTFVSENMNNDFNLDLLQEQLVGLVGNENCTEENNVIEQHEKTVSMGDMV